MEKSNIQELINKYIDYSFSVTKKAENLIRKEIGDDITTEQHYTLRYINSVGVCTSTELAEVFDVKKSAITGAINRLVERGLIDRKRDEGDRRVIYLSLTPKGMEVYEKAQQKIHSLVGEIITKFDNEEIDRFMKTYEKLNQVLVDLKDLKQGESV
ncbi:DNA-binding MarR family transcriptional regulator [Bacillus mesophilus]|uniref:MarR family transcriptional regulator n=1 Tax=Bacillus mesophilus TaxID=1808955 RepID=A0A6M0QBT1_9BACI|nr:MarR family transcriptional regulator [Bacillus mesophilus]MBM7660091.1 DNA-binding MarR family transcriptional regulator [Bacillus mesophilus]NEY73746.1 MarR family transcriptional regulator [Bacillus mesophilus]